VTGFSVDLAGKTAVVTGATRGIGAAIATALADSGAHVVCLQRGELPKELDGRATRIAVDLSDPAAVDAAVERIAAEHPADILVNNAGINLRHPFEDFPDADWHQVHQVNLHAVFTLCRGLGAGMVERGGGKIVNIASLLSFQGGYTAAAYASSKGAVAQLTKALANEWAAKGVNVNAIAPGYIATELNAPLIADPVRSRQIGERIPAGRWGDPADIAGAVLFLVSPAAAYVHGTVLPVDGGWLGR
jgi:2-dehydro-3-deoxy-D-gluconate 5-dehydrogenase